jgi:copper homeostasis protein
MKTKLEICIDSCFGIDACVEGGADRIELCRSLQHGGLTPTYEVLKLASDCGLPVRSMIRPKKGSFVYSSEDLKQMQGDVDMVRSFDIEGVVFGATLPNGSLDQDFLEKLASHSFGLNKTLHRAVDKIHQTINSVEIGIELGFDTILSSGGKKTALEGLSVLSDMQMQSYGKIKIMPGSGINALSVRKILNQCHFDWIHSSCSIKKNGDRLTDVQSIKNLKNAII